MNFLMSYNDLKYETLAITPVNPTHPFELPPTGDTVLDFVNELGYPEPVEFVSSIRMNYVHQPWRAILSLLNQCLTGKSSVAAAARQPGPTIETRLLDTERRIITALELVNRRVSYQVDVCTRESSEFCTRHHDAQTDRAAMRAEIEVLRRERLAYEQEGMETRQALARS
ncbi:hypothetical protein Tco_0254108, partial [Tanacetum coccineum]